LCREPKAYRMGRAKRNPSPFERMVGFASLHPPYGSTRFIARRANVSQPVMLDLTPKSAISITPSRPGKRGVSRTSGTRDGMRWTQTASLTNEAGCGRQSRVVLAPRRWCQVCGAIHRRRWLTSPAHRGDHGVTVKTIARGMPGDSGEPVVTTLVCSTLPIAREAMGAAGTRHSLRPLLSWAMVSCTTRANRAAGMRSRATSASETKQSRTSETKKLNCFVSLAMTVFGCLKIESTLSSSSRPPSRDP
jgi:hypothetical protein